MKPSEQARTRRLRRICRSLEIDELAGTIIVELLERIEAMQHDLQHLRAFPDVRETHKSWMMSVTSRRRR